MPEFTAGEQKVATVPMTNPTSAPFDYLVELYMGTNLAIVAQTTFHLNAGELKNITLPVTMPSEAGTYPVYLGVFSGGVFIEPLYQGEDVVITGTPPATILAGTILDAKWRETGTTQWHSWPLSVPAYTQVDVKWRVRNNSNGLATFSTGIISLSRYRIYTQTLAVIEPGEEADLIYVGFAGQKGGTSGSQTFYLAALAGEVTSTSQLDWYGAALVDSVSLQFSWY